jgi:multidrug resistance protein
MTAVATQTTTRTGVNREVMAVFAGLMLGSLIASLNMTLVAPALPTIVAELGGLADYTWIPISAMLASTIVVPLAGKLSDVYGRKPLYMTGVIVFAIGSLLSGVAPNFWFLVFARFVQGAGMGFLMPLSQAIIGDIISPRERGKYQGMMGASFGLASIIGPAAGGFITQYYSWRWLFFVNLPFAALTLLVVALYMHVPNERRKHSIDVAGSVTLSLGVSAVLLATRRRPRSRCCRCTSGRAASSRSRTSPASAWPWRCSAPSSSCLCSCRESSATASQALARSLCRCWSP